MKHSKTICVEDKVVDKNSIRSICSYFEELPKRKTGKTEIIVHYNENDEVSGNGKEVIDTIFVRNKPVSRIDFGYRSEDWCSHLSLSIKDQFSSSSYCGLYYKITSDDDVWFNVTRSQMQDVMEAVPATPCIYRFFKSWGWIVSIVAACCISFGTVHFLRWIIHRTGWQVTNFMSELIVAGLLVVFLGAVVCLRGFLNEIYPVIDFDLFNDREKLRLKFWKVFWVFISVIVIPILKKVFWGVIFGA